MPRRLSGEVSMQSPFFTEHHEKFRKSIRQFLSSEVEPHVDEWENQGQIPRSLWTQMGDRELLGLLIPESYGGTGSDFFYAVTLMEELVKTSLNGLAGAVSSHQMQVLQLLHRYGSKALKEDYLTQGIRGKLIGALAIAEPQSGNDISGMDTRAERQGNYYRINGAKTFVTNGLFGDFMIVAAKTKTRDRKEGITLILVDATAKGVERSRIEKEGWNCVDTAEVTFDNVRVPVTHRIGQDHKGLSCLMDVFQIERIISAITSSAGAKYCLKSTIRYLKRRQDVGKPLAHLQAVRHQLSDLAADIESSEQLGYFAAWLQDLGEPALTQATLAKLKATECFRKTADMCLQLFGSNGFTGAYDILRMFRDSRVATVVNGHSELLREQIGQMIIDSDDPAKAKAVEDFENQSEAEPEDSNGAISDSSSNGQAEKALEHPVDMGRNGSHPKEDSQDDSKETVVKVVVEPLDNQPEAPSTPHTPKVPERPAAVEGDSIPGPAVVIVEESRPAEDDPAIAVIEEEAVEESETVLEAEVAEELTPETDEDAKAPEDQVERPSTEDASEDEPEVEKEQLLAAEESSDVSESNSLSDSENPSGPRDETMQIKVDIDELIKATERIDDISGIEGVNDEDGDDKENSATPDARPKISSKLPESLMDDLEPDLFHVGSSEEKSKKAKPQKAQSPPSPQPSKKKKSAAPKAPVAPPPDSPEEQLEGFLNVVPHVHTPSTVLEIFQGLPTRFRPDQAGNYKTIFHFRIRGNDGGDYTVIIGNGQCRVAKGFLKEPLCLVETSAKTYMDIELRHTNPQVAFMMGKVRVSSVPEMMQFAKVFHKLPQFLITLPPALSPWVAENV